jgi:hypothetical protein
MPELKINAVNEVAHGKYANIVSVTAQERDIVIDFISMVNMGGEAQSQLVSRIFLNRFTAKELSQLIQIAEQNWEKQKYGASQPPIPKT